MKKRHFSVKKVLSTVMALLMVLPILTVGIIPQEADAATPGSYYYKVTFEVTDDMDAVELLWYLNGKTCNGTFQETQIASGGWTNDKDIKAETYTLMEGTTAAGVFPTKVTLTDNNNDYWVLRTLGGNIHLYVGPDSSNLTEIYLNGEIISQSDVDKLECGSGNGAWFLWGTKVAGAKSRFTVEYSAGNNMPYINSVTVASTTRQNVTIPANGTAYSSSQTTAVVKDQYGVVWYEDASWAFNTVNEPTLASSRIVGISADAGRLGVDNNAKDYLGSSKAMPVYINAHCGGVMSSTIEVKITNIQYTVNFYDSDFTTVIDTQNVYYQSAASAPAKTPAPTNNYDTQYHFSWGGWDKDINYVTSDLDVYPTFNAVRHTYTATVKTPATCTAKGTTTYTCSCGYSYDAQDINIKSHVYTAKDTSPEYLKSAATCNAAAVYYYKCQTCSAKSSNTYTSGAALGHSWDTGEVLTAATCCTEGSANYTCTRTGCGQTITMPLPVDANAHDFGEWETVTSATCTAKGSEKRVCAYNTDHTETRETEATGHNCVSVPAVAATCETAGNNAYFRCSTCGAYFTDAAGKTATTPEAQTVAALGHAWDDGEVLTAASCTAEGSVKYTCTREGCGETKTEKITSAGHSWNDGEIISAATCSATGTIKYKCTVCTAEKEEPVSADPDAHSFGEWETVTPATCTADGLKKRVCVYNSTHIEEAVIERSAHTTAEIPAVAPTCTADGATAGVKCQVCNTVLVTPTVIPAKGHTEVIDKAAAPTCTETGLTEGKHCSVCKAVIVAQKVVDKIGHTEVIDKAAAPTCTETGLTEGKHCSVCKTVIVAQMVVDKIGHTEVIDKAVAPTCTETGLTEGKHCSVCKAVIVAQKVVDKIGHTEVIDKAVAPTCTKTGLTEGKHCSVCGTVFTAQNIINATGHKAVTDKAVAPTCTKTGLTEGSHCSVCGAVIKAQSVLPKNGHDYTCRTVAPTCTETGVNIYTCRVCGDSYTQTIAKSAHTDGNGDGICDECGGNISVNCSHLCHKTGFLGFIWKIINFFNKLFKINQYCSCGAKHW